MIWEPSTITEQERSAINVKQLNRLSQSVIRSSVDFDLDQVTTWLNYYALLNPGDTYIPKFRLPQMNNAQPRNDHKVQELLKFVEVFSKRIIKRENIKVHFFDGLLTYFSYGKPKDSHLYFNNRVPDEFNTAQIIFLVAKSLFSLQRKYFSIAEGIKVLREDSKKDLLRQGIYLLKRAASSSTEKNSLPEDITKTLKNPVPVDSLEELLVLTERCHRASNFAEFSYLKELLASPAPFRQSMNIEGDTFALKFVNIYDASLAIVHLLSGKEQAEKIASEGFANLLSDGQASQSYLKQRISNLWLSYYINNCEPSSDFFAYS